MAGVFGRSHQTVDSTSSPVNFYTEGPTDAMPNQTHSGTRRGSFLFRSDSEEAGVPRGSHAAVMTGSASAARLTSMIHNQQHETCVIIIIIIIIDVVDIRAESFRHFL